MCEDCYRHVRELVHKNLTLFKEVERFRNPQDIVNRACDREKAHDDFYGECDDTNNISSESDTTPKENDNNKEFLSNMRKGFLHKNMQEDGRKKLHNEIDV